MLAQAKLRPAVYLARLRSAFGAYNWTYAWRSDSAPRTASGHPNLPGYWSHRRQNFDLQDYPETYDMRVEPAVCTRPRKLAMTLRNPLR